MDDSNFVKDYTELRVPNSQVNTAMSVAAPVGQFAGLTPAELTRLLWLYAAYQVCWSRALFPEV